MITVQNGWKNILDFYGIEETDLQLLHRHKEFFDRHAQEIVDDFYEQITRLHHLSKLIQEHSTLERLKKTQVWYFKTLSSPAIDDEYVAGREKIGAVHAEIGLSALWFLGGYSIYLRLIADKIESCSIPDGFQLYQAISRRIMFDAAITIEQYIKDLFKINETYRKNMEEASKVLMESVQQVSTIATEFANSAAELAAFQETVVQSVNDLTHSSKKIGELSKFVLNVASQTNLLGLNASIVAAHAGEHGRGFSVVANEVRNLADRTKSSSQDIKKSVDQVLERVHTISEQVENAMAISRQQAASSQELRALIENIEAAALRLSVKS